MCVCLSKKTQRNESLMCIPARLKTRRAPSCSCWVMQLQTDAKDDGTHVPHPGRKASPASRKGQTRPAGLLHPAGSRSPIPEGMWSPEGLVWSWDLSLLRSLCPCCAHRPQARRDRTGLKRDKNPEKWAAALAGEWGKLTEPLAAAEAIWGSSPSRTPPGAKPQIFPNNEIQPQINPHQYVDKLLVFEITSLPTMKLSHFSTSTCSSQENQILTSESWKCWFSTLHLPSRPGNADFLHNTFPSHFQSWKGTWKCWFSTLHLPFTLPGNTWEVLLHTKAISKFAAAAGFEDPSQQTWYLSWFKSFIFLLSSVNVTFPCQGTVTE